MTIGSERPPTRSAHVDPFCREHLPPVELWPELLLDGPDVAYPERLNCAVSLLDDVVTRLGPDRPALIDAAGARATWSYGDLAAAVDAVAHVLVDDLGVVPGNRVLLRGPNTPELVACWLAVLKAGAVAVTTMPLLRAKELTTVAAIASVDVALCDHRFLAEATAADLGRATLVPFGGPGPDDLLRRAAGRRTPFTAVDTAADDVALLAFTSGTTGRPKATMHFHRDVLAIADTFGRHIVRIAPDDIVVGTPPLAFTFGLGGLLVFPMRVGAAMVMLEKATPQELAEKIAATRATVCFTAPTAYRAMLRAGLAGQLRTLRRAVSAGEHLPAATWEAFHATTGVRLIDGIGSTELLHVFISAADDDIRPGATGRAVPGYRATILGVDGQELPAGEPGRLAVKGPTGCRYLDDPRQRDYVENGWNITGDTFVQDADGYFYFRARNDDMIVSSGYNIAGPEVEEALQEHPAVLECCVVGHPDAERGQLVTAFVVLVPGVEGTDALKAELQAFVKQQIAPYKYPRAVEFVPELPRTSTGKVQRFVLRDRALTTQ
jgi:2-aminobenzoate-CoA ligase